MKKKIGKWLNYIVTTLLFIALISVAILVIIPKFTGGEPEVFGHQLKTVLSGSMEPGIQTGSIIAVKPGGDMTRFKKDDIITFRDADQDLVTHRIIDVKESGENTLYQTKGDNNNAPDVEPVLSDNVVAAYDGFTIPYAGYVTAYAQSKNGAFLLLIPGFLLLMYSGFTIWRALSQLELKEDKDKELTSKSS